MLTNGLLSSFVAAIQASLSVLLVISYGSIAAKFGLLDSSHGKAISKICVKMFLPALLVQIGSELHPDSATRYLVIFLWALACHFVSFLLGVFARLVFGLPHWVMVAIMFNNTTSYPLLLIQSLDETGILATLVQGDDTTKAMVGRAKSYFLVFATVSTCLTFAVGPRLMGLEHAPGHDTVLGQRDDCGVNAMRHAREAENGESSWPYTERTSLLAPEPRSHETAAGATSVPLKSITAATESHSFRNSYLGMTNLNPRAKWWLRLLLDFLNAPLLGAVVGVVIGLSPRLQHAFFNNTNNGGIFTAWLTESWKSIGSLFVPLPLIVAGISLYTSYQEGKSDSHPTTSVPKATTAFILAVRFVLWPATSISTIYGLVRKSGSSEFLSSDPMLCFAMMLMPTGPPAMKLITMVMVSNSGVAEERRMAKILTTSYIVSPVLAFTVVGALRASQAAV